MVFLTKIACCGIKCSFSWRNKVTTESDLRGAAPSQTRVTKAPGDVQHVSGGAGGVGSACCMQQDSLPPKTALPGAGGRRRHVSPLICGWLAQQARALTS